MSLNACCQPWDGLGTRKLFGNAEHSECLGRALVWSVSFRECLCVYIRAQLLIVCDKVHKWFYFRSMRVQCVSALQVMDVVDTFWNVKHFIIHWDTMACVHTGKGKHTHTSHGLCLMSWKWFELKEASSGTSHLYIYYFCHLKSHSSYCLCWAKANSLLTAENMRFQVIGKANKLKYNG